jgi:hypothetical protein
MRQVIGGNGTDTTAATQSYLLGTPSPLVRDLYVIGRPGEPNTIYLTNHEAPLLYTPYGTFNPAVVSRDKVTVKVGLDSSEMAITWAPGNQAATSNTGTASPQQLAQLHFYDNWPVLILRCFMPMPGDANTLGCTVWWGGRVHTAAVKRNSLVFNCKDYLDTLSQKVPSAVVEVTNTLASSAAATLPTSPAGLPVFEVVTGSSENNIIGACTSPSPGNIYGTNQFAGGYMVFLAGSGATLAGCWSAIGQNQEFSVGPDHYNAFQIYQQLPYPPTPGVDTFYVSMQAPTDITETPASGFPYVPTPQQAV